MPARPREEAPPTAESIAATAWRRTCPPLLTGKHCKLYMKFRANVLALKEQAAIEQAMQADGSDGVAAALDRLMGTETGATQPAAPTASGEPGADSSADDADDYEWNLSP